MKPSDARSEPTPGQPHPSAALAADEIRVEGTVKASQVGAGCWQFVGTDGTSYELRRGQAPTTLFVDGTHATLVLRRRADLMSTCQVGQIVDVVRVEQG
jgi:hypothetical protein